MNKINNYKILLVILLFYSSVFAQRISVSAFTDSSHYKIGDYIKYNLLAKYDKNVRIIFPSVRDSIKNLEFIEELKPVKKEENNKFIENRIYVFSKYDSASVTIPSYKIFYQVAGDSAKYSIDVNPITITVSTLKVEPQKDIRDIKSPMKIPLSLIVIILIVIIIIAVITLAYFIYRYFRSKKLSKNIIIEETKIPPHEIALNELKKLEEQKLWQKGLVKEYHSEITGIIRKYFEERFNFRALEMTTSEILACLSYLDEGKPILNLSNDFFNNADMVKFAKFEPMPIINEEMMKQAYKIVYDTIPKMEEVKSEGEVKDVR
ncbi:MAG: hypothetical protein N2249_05410 [Melioribacter sp.]|nr:hypothetical protein [Melioribacter sp.]